MPFDLILGKPSVHRLTVRRYEKMTFICGCDYFPVFIFQLPFYDMLAARHYPVFPLHASRIFMNYRIRQFPLEDFKGFVKSSRIYHPLKRIDLFKQGQHACRSRFKVNFVTFRHNFLKKNSCSSHIINDLPCHLDLIIHPSNNLPVDTQPFPVPSYSRYFPNRTPPCTCSTPTAQSRNETPAKLPPWPIPIIDMSINSLPSRSHTRQPLALLK